MNKKRFYAVIGDPIKHSKSPNFQNAAFHYYNIPAEYHPVKVTIEELPLFMQKAKNNLSGFNVTVPLKTAIIPELDSISNLSKISNSVNTVVVENNCTLYGTSTDGYGLEMAIKKSFSIKELNKENILFIGCGGATKACAVHLLQQGLKNISFVNRTVSKAEQFINKLKTHFCETNLSFCGLEEGNKIKDFLSYNPIVIQSTSVGLTDNIFPISPSYLTKNLRIIDMIYKKTPLVIEAEKKGCNIGDGRLMLLFQGAKSFSLWTNRIPPLTIMEKALFKF